MPPTDAKSGRATLPQGEREGERQFVPLDRRTQIHARPLKKNSGHPRSTSPARICSPSANTYDVSAPVIGADITFPILRRAADKKRLIAVNRPLDSALVRMSVRTKLRYRVSSLSFALARSRTSFWRSWNTNLAQSC